ncbi:MAG: GatB/YqeY domain-containing protein [Patescibacteria group bacterium]
MLHEQIKKTLKEALLAKDEVRLLTVRGLLSAFVNELVAKKMKPDAILSDEDALSVIKRGVKQRKDSIEQFTEGNRPDLAELEKAELAILLKYLPETMSRDQIRPIAVAKMKELGITEKSKMGMLMGALSKELKGQAEGADIKAVVDELLS